MSAFAFRRMFRTCLAALLLLSLGILHAQTPAAPDPHLPNLLVLGDASAAHGNVLASFFDMKKINVMERNAERIDMPDDAWQRILAQVKPGDVILLQFRNRDGALPGISDAMRVAANGKDTLQTFGWYLRRYAVDAIAKGATPIVISAGGMDSPESAKPAAGKQSTPPEDPAEWSRQIAMQQRIPFIDLEKTLQSAGDSEATGIVAGLKGLMPDPLAGYFSTAGSAIKGKNLEKLQKDSSEY